MLPSTEFQLELAKTQAEGTEVTVESTDEEKVLLMVSGMVEKQDDIAEDLGMEIEAINATLMESGVDMEEERSFRLSCRRKLSKPHELRKCEFTHRRKKRWCVVKPTSRKTREQGFWRRGKETARGFSSLHSALQEAPR